jgi:glycosyltransferase involved in cell wall biosynthesis
MRLLFLHKNLPGQFRRLAPALAAKPGREVVTLGERMPGKGFAHPGLRDCWYPRPKGAGKDTHHYIRRLEANVRRGQAVYRALTGLRRDGFSPDVVVAHPGWGETLFLKDVYPDTKLLCFWEFFYRSKGSDLGFDPEFPASVDAALRSRMHNATHLSAFEDCDWGVAPTRWQRSLFPAFMRERISVLFEGVDADVARPDPGAGFQVPGGPRLTREDEVLTYVARNLEPYRGFHTFMRALPEILQRRPNCRVLVVGSEGVSYGAAPKGGGSWRAALMEETGLGSCPGFERVLFLGRLAYEDYLAVLRVSSVHLYMTYPFVLSWSCLEAMSAGCLVLGADTAPVREVIDHERNGLLLEDMLDPACVAERAAEALEHRGEYGPLREAARETILEGYDFRTTGLPGYERLLAKLAS